MVVVFAIGVVDCWLGVRECLSIWVINCRSLRIVVLIWFLGWYVVCGWLLSRLVWWLLVLIL